MSWAEGLRGGSYPWIDNVLDPKMFCTDCDWDSGDCPTKYLGGRAEHHLNETNGEHRIYWLTRVVKAYESAGPPVHDSEDDAATWRPTPVTAAPHTVKVRQVCEEGNDPCWKWVCACGDGGFANTSIEADYWGKKHAAASERIDELNEKMPAGEVNPAPLRAALDGEPE